MTVRDSDPTTPDKTVKINADGSYSVDVSGLKAPFMLQAAGTVGNRSYTIYSATNDAGTVNVTPLTDLIVANAAGKAADSVFNAADFSKLTNVNLDAAKATLKQRLLPVLQAAKADGADMMNGVFPANHTGLDAALDLLDVSVDDATNAATIKVKGDGASISDDLSTSSDVSEVAPTTNLSVTAADLQAIAQQFSAFNAALQSATTVDASLTKYFVASGFLWMGQNDPSVFLGSLLRNKPESIDAVSVDSLARDSNGQTIGAQVSFRIETPEGREYSESTQMTKNPSTGEWLIAGDQRIADITVNAFTNSCWTNPNGTLQGCGVTSGIQFYIGTDGPAGASIDHADISGPGIVATTLKKSTGKNYLNDGSGGNMLNLSDAVIGGIKAGTPYTITLYDANNAKLAQYTINLPKQPYLSTAVDPKGSFPFLTDASFNMLSAGPKGTFTLSWTLPQSLKMESVVLSLTDDVGHTFNLDSGVEASATSFTYPTNISGNVVSRYGYLYARDAYGRKMGLYFK